MGRPRVTFISGAQGFSRPGVNVGNGRERGRQRLQVKLNQSAYAHQAVSPPVSIIKTRHLSTSLVPIVMQTRDVRYTPVDTA